MNPFNDVVLSSDELEQVQREVLGMWGCECESDVWECLRHQLQETSEANPRLASKLVELSESRSVLVRIRVLFELFILLRILCIVVTVHILAQEGHQLDPLYLQRCYFRKDIRYFSTALSAPDKRHNAERTHVVAASHNCDRCIHRRRIQLIADRSDPLVILFEVEFGIDAPVRGKDGGMDHPWKTTIRVWPANHLNSLSEQGLLESLGHAPKHADDLFFLLQCYYANHYFILWLLANCAGVDQDYICFFNIISLVEVRQQKCSYEVRIVDIHLTTISLNEEGEFISKIEAKFIIFEHSICLLRLGKVSQHWYLPNRRACFAEPVDDTHREFLHAMQYRLPASLIILNRIQWLTTCVAGKYVCMNVSCHPVGFRILWYSPNFKRYTIIINALQIQIKMQPFHKSNRITEERDRSRKNQIIIRKFMGCGASCTDTTASNKQPSLLGVACLATLLTKLHSASPLLTDKCWQKFAAQAGLDSSRYQLRIGDTLSLGQAIPSLIIEKWKIVILGIDRENQYYRNALGLSPFSELVGEKYRHPQNEQVDVSAKELKWRLPKADTELKMHQCFAQIEKDLNRTFQFNNSQKVSFERVLKQIANHFPKMGYTQGVNFVVGYLLIIGYNEAEAFWLFVHLAINKRYMLLGLYDDGFPLTNVFSTVFSNVLRRVDNELHKRIFETLNIDSSVWIFKWFITCYLYSFPVQFIKYVWDVFITVGAFGLVSFAVAVVLELKKHILSLEDIGEISLFFLELKELDNFNTAVNLRRVIEGAYTYLPTSKDFQGVAQCRGGVYAQLSLQTLRQEACSPSSAEQLLNTQEKGCCQTLKEWYTSLKKERDEFACEKLLEVPKLVNQSIEEELEELEDILQISNTFHISQKDMGMSSIDGEQQKMQAQTNIQREQTELYWHSRIKQKVGKDLAGKISEKDDEEDSQAKDEKKPEAILDELDLFKMKLASKVKPNGKTSTVAKNNQKLLSTCLKKSGLAHTGEKALMQISVHSIMSSTPARQKAQKQKQNGLNFPKQHRPSGFKIDVINWPSMEGLSSGRNSVSKHADSLSIASKQSILSQMDQVMRNGETSLTRDVFQSVNGAEGSARRSFQTKQAKNFEQEKFQGKMFKKTGQRIMVEPRGQPVLAQTKHFDSALVELGQTTLYEQQESCQSIFIPASSNGLSRNVSQRESVLCEFQSIRDSQIA